MSHVGDGRVHTHTHACTHAHTHTHTHMHAHARTHARTLPPKPTRPAPPHHLAVHVLAPVSMPLLAPVPVARLLDCEPATPLVTSGRGVLVTRTLGPRPSRHGASFHGTAGALPSGLLVIHGGSGGQVRALGGRQRNDKLPQVGGQRGKLELPPLVNTTIGHRNLNSSPIHHHEAPRVTRRHHHH